MKRTRGAGPSRRFTVRLDPEVYDKLQWLAKIQNKDESDIIRLAVAEHLGLIEPLPKANGD